MSSKILRAVLTDPKDSHPEQPLDRLILFGADGKPITPGNFGPVAPITTPGAYVQSDPPIQTGPGIWVDPDTEEIYYQAGGVAQGPTDVDVIQALATAAGFYKATGPGQMAFQETHVADSGKVFGVDPTGQPALLVQAAMQAGSAMPAAFPGFMGPAFAGILATANPALVGQNQRHFVRLISPKAGALRDLTIFAGAPGAGNYLASLYDVGGITPGTYTKLWESGSVVAANTVPQVFDPAAIGTKFNNWDGNVSAYQHLMFSLVADSATTSAGRVSLGAAAYALLSTTRGLVGGLQPKMFGIGTAGAFSAPATLIETDVAVTSTYALAAYGWVI